MPRLARSTPALSLAVSAALVLGPAAVAGCSDDGDADEAEEVGGLETVVGDDQLSDAVDVAAGGDEVWVATGEGRVLEVSGDDMSEVEGLDAVSTAAGIAADDNGTLFATDADRRNLVRYRAGELENGAVPAVQDLSALAAADDGTVFVADHDGLQVVSIDASGRVGEVVDDALAGPMTVASDGTLYYVDDQVLDGRIVALRPGGGPERVTREVERDDDGNPVEPPSEGAAAGDSYIEARDLAATEDGLLVLTFTNEVWRIGDDDELELVLRRGGDSALVALAASGDDIYVLDAGTATLSTLDAGD
jgi:outer membrane protein assembly factor BamB